MAIQRKNRTDLRAYFQTGDRPTQAEFEELIESGVNIIEDKAIQVDIDAATPSDDKFVTVSSAQKVARKSITVNGTAADLATGNIQIVNVPASSITGVIPANLVDLSGKQNTLISGSNIRTINGNSLLGSSDLLISGGSSSVNQFIANDVSIINFGTSGATVGTLFCAVTSLGTVSQVAPSSANRLASIQRVKFLSAATAGAISGTRSNLLECFIGSLTLGGGFISTVRFGLSTLQVGMRSFVGLSSVSNIAPTNIDPIATNAGHKIGMAINLNTGNWKLIHNTALSAPTVIDLGASFPVNNTDFYELTISSVPNATSINYKVKNLITGIENSGTLTANLPTNTVFMGRTMWVTNNATAAAVSLDLNKWVLEKN